jgi:alpha-beta hydrolase superfamily lysophospholipase
MNHQEGFLDGLRGPRIYYQAWLPETAAKAVLLLVHGLAEHGGRYASVVGHFVPRGYAVYAIDHVGHGKSEGQRVFVERFRDFLDPLARLHDLIRARHPDVPVFMVGHSLGGLIGATYLLERQDDFRGAVLSGPAVKVPDNLSPLVIMIGRAFSALLPRLGIVALAHDGVSRDPAVVEAYVNDPLVHTGRITARLGAEMLDAMGRIGSEAHRIRLPLLVLQGGADKLVDPDGARMLHDRAGSADKTLRTYEGLYHEVYNEPEREAVLAEVEAWLDQRLQRSTAR